MEKRSEGGPLGGGGTFPDRIAYKNPTADSPPRPKEHTRMNRSRKFTNGRTLMGATLALVLAAALPAGLQAQTGAGLWQRAMAMQAERLDRVKDVTITQDVMGLEVVVYMEKRETEGGPILVPVTTIMPGMINQVPSDESDADWSNPFQAEWAERTRIVGEAEVDNQTCTILAIEDFTDLEVPGLPGGETEAGDFTPRVMRFFVDEDDLVMRKMEMEADVTQEDGSAAPVNMAATMSDYRETDGYLHPFKTHTVMEGVADAMDVDKEELERQLAEMKQQMANMPAAMQDMIASQVERLEEMLGEGGAMEVTITVKSVKVNAGPPGGG
jgi:hypothetical protein